MRQQEQVTGFAATMTTVAMGLGSAVVLGDLRILSANISIIRNGLHFSPSTTIFVSSLATLTLAASVLGAGVLGDRYGMKRMFLGGAWATVAFGLIGAAAPNVVVLMIARACIGVAFAFLSGLSLAIMNAAFPAEKRAGAIARYLAAVYAFGVLPATVGGLLVEHIGWRSGLLVTPVLAAIVAVITLRYVPETLTSQGKTDVAGLVLIAAALIGIIYGISRLQSGVDLEAVAPIVGGLTAGAAFVWWELRCENPALDLRIFRSTRFNAVVTAGMASNVVQGASAIMATFYLVVIRELSTSTFALMFIPATLLSALAAIWAGRAATRWGNCAVLVGGLVVMAVSLLVRVAFGFHTPIVAVWMAMALMAIGGAIVGTPQTTVMMSSAPVHLSGVVSAVKASVAGTFYGLGSALFSMLGILLFIRDAGPRLAGSGVSPEQAGETLAATAHSPGGSSLDPERTQWVVSQATSSMLSTAHTLNVILTVITLAAAVVAIMLFRRGHAPADIPASER
ncbi:MAG: MFS transporter [Mycobacterium sp.]|nr:MFS transporter [Mycobacterium sp.]